jgi:hypothetical protein
MHVETVKIKTAPCPGNEAGELLINCEDYDPAKHQLAGAPAPQADPVPPAEPDDASPQDVNPKGKKKGR